jgi:hypothetical protein
MKMRKVSQTLGLVAFVATTYVAAYSIWRGPAMQWQCDHPKVVYLQNGPLAVLFMPLIAADRSMNRFTTEIYLD